MVGFGRHTSLNRDLRSPITQLRRQTGVTRVALGVFHPCRHKFPAGTLRIMSDSRTGFKLNAYAGDGVQTVFVYIVTSQHENVRQTILKHAPPTHKPR